jgi:hypothetical protein
MDKKEAWQIYISIIKEAKLKNRKKLTVDNENYERRDLHHIFPRSLFPRWKNKPWNKVILTMWEHAEIHELACFIWPSYKMLSSFLILPKKELKYFSEKDFEKYYNKYIIELCEKRQSGNKLKARKIICLETGEIFNSKNEACRKKGSHIGEVCDGKRISSNNLHFQWYDEFLKGIEPPYKKLQDTRKERMIYYNKYINKNKGANHYKAKKVKCIETEEIFGYEGEARKKYPAASKIKRCCSLKKGTSGGYHWEYVD